MKAYKCIIDTCIILHTFDFVIWNGIKRCVTLSKTCLYISVKLENAQVQSKASDGSDEKFKVSTPL